MTLQQAVDHALDVAKTAAGTSAALMLHQAIMSVIGKAKAKALAMNPLPLKMQSLLGDALAAAAETPQTPAATGYLPMPQGSRAHDDVPRRD